jgi:YXYXY domain-containing protein
LSFPNHSDSNRISEARGKVALNFRVVDDPLGLPARTTSLRIAFAAASMTMPERVRFRFKLDGVDKDWQDAGTRRETTYTYLGPGSYRFQVIACNDDGVWNEAGAVSNFAHRAYVLSNRGFEPCTY